MAWGLLFLIALSSSYAAEEVAPGARAAAKQMLLPTGPPSGVPFVNLEPQYQHLGFNSRGQPQVVFLAGAAPPGQQFLYQSGGLPPPGNFLIPQPQPQPQPQPGPNLIFGNNPGGPVFVAGYPKPAHVPPIEKDAEEVPSLAGNHPPSSVGRPIAPQQPSGDGRRPEKLETLDEPLPFGEVDVLAAADKNPNSGYPKKAFPNVPQLKPGQQFFILNGNPLFSNFPLDLSNIPQTNYHTGLHQSNPEVFVYRPQPQYVSGLQNQDLFLRNFVTGQIADVKTPSFEAPLPVENGNYISLNNANDFRQNVVIRNQVPLTSASSNGFPNQFSPLLLKSLSEGKPAASLQDSRQGKRVELVSTLSPYNAGLLYPGLNGFTDYYQYANPIQLTGEDDTVVIDAKLQEDDKTEAAPTPVLKVEEPALSQAQPSAVALSGIGGIASAGPRATALVGIRGLAVAKPQATAVAGPADEDAEKKAKSKKQRQ